MTFPFQDLHDREGRRIAFNLLGIAYVPQSTVCPTCGAEVNTGGALDIACPDCGGSGYVTTWMRSGVRCRKVSMEPATFNVFAGGAVASSLQGDYLLQGSVGDRRIYDKVRDTEGAYILVGGERLKPTAISPNTIEGDVVLEIRTKLVGDSDAIR